MDDMVVRLANVGAKKSPLDHERCDVWPKGREHLLDEGYEYTLVAAMIKTGHNMSDALLHFHWPTLYNNPNVLFCDTGDHICIYLCEKIDKVTKL